MDITELIVFQHHEQRRQFALLDEVHPDDTKTLAGLWRRLSVLLGMHAEAEERYFYPEVLRLGHGAPGSEDGPAAETQDAIKDHTRSGTASVGPRPTGLAATPGGRLFGRRG